ncbi:MAG: hypothetical protein IPJ16_05965 [Bacteroidales bacterium]|nr:hypothetical protein [Bacteroidales bacterium]
MPYTATTNSPTSYSINWATLADQGSTAYAFVGGGGNVPNIAVPAGTAAATYLGTMTITNANGCAATQAISLTVNPLPTPVITGNTDVCANVIGEVYSVTPAAGRSYVWSISGGAITAGAGTNSITVTWGAAGAGWVKVVETIVATTCSVTTANYDVTINPGAPATAPTFTSGPVDICLNGTLNLNVSDVATASSYIWDYSWVAGVNNNTTAVSQVAIDLTGLLPNTYTVTVAAANGCGTGPSMAPVHTFDVNDIPDLSPLTNTVCSDVASAITLSITNSGAYCSGITFNIPTITKNGLTESAGAPVTGTGFASNEIVNDAYTNKTAASVNVVYAVIPVSTQGCTGASENVTLTVTPEPDLNNLNTTVCSDASTGVTLTDVHSLANSFNIVSITPQAGLVTTAGNAVTGAGQAANAILNDKWTNKTAGSLTVTYAIIPRIAAGCIGDQENVVITISPEPDLNLLTSTVCSDAVTGITLSDVHGLASRFEIVSITPQAGLVAGGSNATVGTLKLSSAIVNDTWTNKTAGALTVTYAIIPRVNLGCIGDQENVVVTVNPEPDLNL